MSLTCHSRKAMNLFGRSKLLSLTKTLLGIFMFGLILTGTLSVTHRSQAQAVQFAPISHVQAQATTPNKGEGKNTTWSFIADTKGIVNVWKVSLSLVDFLVVVGLLIAAFANIFRFNINTYGVKQVLPGLIIGIILANLSFFIMRLFLEGTGIISQMIGIIVAPYTTYDIGSLAAGPFIVHNLSTELIKSLFIFPQGFQTLGAFTVGLITIGVVAGGVTGGAIFLLVLILGFMFLPLLLFLVLLFLLYIREYILTVLFMISPLAFFSLGFPPLKPLWQRWWGTFWKWLLMAPAAIAILAFDLLFLFKVNEGITAPTFTPGRSVADYFFINGVGVALLFLANRIPFMWGSFFGFNAMQRWSKLGSDAAKTTHRSAKWINDKAVEVGARQRYYAANGRPIDLKKVRGAVSAGGAAERDMEARLNRLAPGGTAARRTGESLESYANRVNAEWYRTHSGKLRGAQLAAKGKYNVFRMPESTIQGTRERFRNWESSEERSVKQNEAYGFFGGQEVRDRAALTRFADEYKEIDDEKQAWDKFRKPLDAWMNAGGTAEDFFKYSSMGDTGFMADLNNNPRIQAMMAAGIKRQDIIEAQRALKRFSQIIRPNNYSTLGSLARTKRDAFLNIAADPTRFGFVPPSAPYGSVVPVVAVGAAPSGSTPGGGSAHAPEEMIDLEHRSADALAQYSQEIVQTMPHTAVTAAMEAYKKTEAALLDELKKQGLSDIHARTIMTNLYDRIQKGIKTISTSELKNMAGGQDINTQLVRPIVEGYRDKTKHLNEVVKDAALNMTQAAADLPVHGQVAERFATSLKSDPEQVNTILNQQAAAIQSNSSDAEKIHKIVADLVGDVRPVDSTSTETYKERIQENIKKARGALELLGDPDVTQARQTNDDAAIKQAIQTAINRKVLAQHALVESAKNIDAVVDQEIGANETGEIPDLVANGKLMEEIKERIQNALVEYSPQLKQQYNQADEATKQQLDEVINQVTTQLVKNLQAAREGGYGARDYLNNNQEQPKIEMRNWIERALRDGFAQVSVPPPA